MKNPKWLTSAANAYADSYYVGSSNNKELADIPKKGSAKNAEEDTEDYSVMTKNTFRGEFRVMWAQAVAENPHLKGDTIAKREYWSDIVGMLVQDGSLPERAVNWSNPN